MFKKTMVSFFVILIFAFTVQNVSAFNGTYTIGSSGDYATLQDFFYDLEITGLSGNAELIITEDLEVSSAIYINEWSGMRENNYTVTIKPDGNSLRRIYGSIASDGVIVINAARRVIIDGQNSQSSNPYNLQIENTNNGAGAAVRLISQGSGYGASDITIRNAYLKAGTPTTSTAFCILSSGTNFGTGSPYAEDSHNLTIENNIFEKAYYGVRVYGISDNRVNNVIIRDNIFGSYNDANRIYYYGIYLYYTENNEITNNTLINLYYYPIYCYYSNFTLIHNNYIRINNSGHNGYGIYMYYSENSEIINNDIGGTESYNIYSGLSMGYCHWSKINDNEISKFRYYGMYIYGMHSCEIINNIIRDADYWSSTYIYGLYFAPAASGVHSGPGSYIAYNKIYNLNNTYTGTSYNYASYGMYFTGTYNTSSIIVESNTIWNIKALGSDDVSYDYYNPHGIRMVSGIDYKFYNNTIIMDGAITGNSGKSSCFFTTSTPSNLEFKNNLFLNRTTKGDNYIYYIYNNTHFSGNDYNIYDKGANNKIGFSKVNTTVYPGISNWKSYAGGETNSKEKTVSIAMYQGIPHLGGEAFMDSDFISPYVYCDYDINGEYRYSSNNYVGTDILNLQDLFITQQPQSITFCDEVEDQQLSFGAGLTFADGIPRNTKPMNQMPYTYEWFFNGNKITSETPNFSLAQNKLHLTNFSEYHNGNYYATVTLSSKQKTTNTASVFADYSYYISSFAPQSRLYYGCYTDPGTTFSINIERHYGGITWYKQNKQTGEWVVIPDANEPELFVNFTELTYDEIVGMYKVIVDGEGLTCLPPIEISETFEIKMDYPVLHSSIYTTDLTGNEMDALYICEEGEVMFNIELDPQSTIFDINWQSNHGGGWQDIDAKYNTSAKTENLVLTNLQPNNTGSYRLRIQGSPYCGQSTYYTPSLEMLIVPYFRISKNPESYLLCENENFHMSASAEGDGEIIGYRWYKDGLPIDVTTNPSAEKPVFEVFNVSLKENGLYTCELTVFDCKGVYTLMSKPAAVYITTETEIVGQTRTRYAVAGGSADLMVKAHARFLPPDFVFDYQWYKYDAARDLNIPLVNNMIYAGVHSDILRISDVSSDHFDENNYDYYFVEVRGKCGTVVSDPIYLKEATGPIYGLDIVTQPQSPDAVCEGENVVIQVEAVTIGDSKTLSYAWFFNGIPLANSGNIQGANSNKLTISSIRADQAGNYEVLVTEQPGGNSEASINAIVTVKTKPIITNKIGEPIYIDESSTELTIDMADYGIEGTQPMSYTWYHEDVLMPGKTDAILTIMNPTMDNIGTYRCMVSNDCGSDEMSVEVVFDDSGVSVRDLLNGTYGLYEPRPNPANSMVNISYELPYPMNVVLTINDATGRQIAELYNSNGIEGTNRFEFDINKEQLSSGIYFIILRTNLFTETKALIINK